MLLLVLRLAHASLEKASLCRALVSLAPGVSAATAGLYHRRGAGHVKKGNRRSPLPAGSKRLPERIMRKPGTRNRRRVKPWAAFLKRPALLRVLRRFPLR